MYQDFQPQNMNQYDEMAPPPEAAADAQLQYQYEHEQSYDAPIQKEQDTVPGSVEEQQPQQQQQEETPQIVVPDSVMPQGNEDAYEIAESSTDMKARRFANGSRDPSDRAAHEVKMAHVKEINTYVNDGKTLGEYCADRKCTMEDCFPDMQMTLSSHLYETKFVRKKKDLEESIVKPVEAIVKLSRQYIPNVAKSFALNSTLTDRAKRLVNENGDVINEYVHKKMREEAEFSQNMSDPGTRLIKTAAKEILWHFVSSNLGISHLANARPSDIGMHLVDKIASRAKSTKMDDKTKFSNSAQKSDKAPQKNEKKSSSPPHKSNVESTSRVNTETRKNTQIYDPFAVDADESMPESAVLQSEASKSEQNRDAMSVYSEAPSAITELDVPPTRDSEDPPRRQRRTGQI